MSQKSLNSVASKEYIAISLQKLRDSFAPRSNDFFVVMVETLQSEGYTGKQIDGAVKEVIKTCGYNQLSISAVVAACEKQPPRYCEWEITTLKEKRKAPYSQFKLDQHRYGVDNVRFIKDIK